VQAYSIWDDVQRSRVKHSVSREKQGERA